MEKSRAVSTNTLGQNIPGIFGDQEEARMTGWCDRGEENERWNQGDGEEPDHTNSCRS